MWWLPVALLLLACHASEPPRASRPPNVLWVVWDTVRADRMSLYGHDRPTTPKLEAWAREARVYTNVRSTAGTTVPSHASMFTGLLPSQHGAFTRARPLDESHDTVAERFHGAGYRTYLWAANPHLSEEQGFQQGFDVSEHPWDPAHHAEAQVLVREKIRGDRSSELARALNRGASARWAVKAAGALAEQSLLAWLEAYETDKPYFAFVNYMEAHQPYVPPRRYRERMMSAEQVAASYEIDRSWLPIWSYTFGLHEYTPEQLEVFARTYDAALLELDDILASLLDALEQRGHLEDTIVVMTADHGEHLGEHHMLDHQYSVYEPVLRIPLVLHYPARVPAGRDDAPVMNLDLHDTLLELAGIGEATGSPTLLSPDPGRLRVSEYPAVFDKPFAAVRLARRGWTPERWARRLHALFEGNHKLILAEDGHRELYDLSRDPLETNDLSTLDAARAERMERLLAGIRATQPHPARTGGPAPALSEQRELLEGLGYLVPEEAE